MIGLVGRGRSSGRGMRTAARAVVAISLAIASTVGIAGAAVAKSGQETAPAEASARPPVEFAPVDPTVTQDGPDRPPPLEHHVDDAEQLRAEALRAGQSLWQGDVIRSANRQFRLAMQVDGNLVVYFAHRPLWSSGTAGHPRAHVSMQADGNLVVYGPHHGPALWSSGTAGHPGAYLAMQTDGNLVVYPPSGPALWATYSYTDRLVAGERLKTGQWLYSPNRVVTLRMQGDGNLVAYGGNRALWQSRSAGHPSAYATMQADGNLVVYSGSGRALWNAGTPGHPGSEVRLQSDGNVVVYAGGAALWNASSFVDRLFPGQGLQPGQYLVSESSGNQLYMQRDDGNLVVYSGGPAVWSSGTAGHPRAYLAMQPDGNLVVYPPSGAALWSSGTAGHPGAAVYLQDDANLVVYAAGHGAALWASKGIGPPPGSTREDKAAAYMRSILGQTHTNQTPDGMWSGWCETAVEVAYNTRGRYPSAIANYSAQAAAGRIHTDGNPPAGALVFYNLSSFGHVGISIGGGQAISTQGLGDVALPVRQHGVTALGAYLGWSYAPDSWPGR